MKITDYSYLSKVIMFLPQKLGVQKLCETFGIQASKTNIMMWGLCMSWSLRAAIHLGLHYEENLETNKLMNFEQIQSSFNITKKLVMENSQAILIVRTIDTGSSCWTRSTLAYDQVKRWSKARVRVYSDSVSFLGKMSSQAEAKTRWSSQVDKLQMCYAVEEFLGIDGDADSSADPERLAK